MNRGNLGARRKFTPRGYWTVEETCQNNPSAPFAFEITQSRFSQVYNGRLSVHRKFRKHIRWRRLAQRHRTKHFHTLCIQCLPVARKRRGRVCALYSWETNDGHLVYMFELTSTQVYFFFIAASDVLPLERRQKLGWRARRCHRVQRLQACKPHTRACYLPAQYRVKG